MLFTDTLNLNYTRTILYLPGFSRVPYDDVEFPVPESVRRLAHLRQAAIVIPEHRCIGPNISLSLDLCTVDQALADIAHLLHVLSQMETAPREVLVVGEGYGGSLAAFFKEKYPQYATYAWAISAPVRFTAFSTEADAQMLIALGNHTELCPWYTRWALAELASSQNTSPAEVYRAAEAVVHAFENGQLRDYCRSMTSQNLPVFLNFVERTMKGVPTIFDMPIGGERAMRCAGLGHFNVHDSEHWLRPPMINESLFTPLCAQVGVDLALAEEALNRRFGGLEIAASAILFTYSRWDVHQASMAVRPDLARDRDVRADLNVQVYDRATVDEDAGQRIVKWLDRTCDPRRGVRVHGQCKCKDGWAGDACREQMITKGKFSGLSALAVAFPTLIVLMTSAVAWKTILVDSENERPNPVIL
jgi:hypothetical protein